MYRYGVDRVWVHWDAVPEEYEMLCTYTCVSAVSMCARSVYRVSFAYILCVSECACVLWY